MRHVDPTSVSAASEPLHQPQHDPITEDLRSFARELGVAGVASMRKDEIVESLRQFYVLQNVLGAAMRDQQPTR